MQHILLGNDGPSEKAVSIKRIHKKALCGLIFFNCLTLPCTWQQPPSPVHSSSSRAAASELSSPLSFCASPLTWASGFLGEPPREFAADSFSLSLPAGKSFEVKKLFPMLVVRLFMEFTPDNVDNCQTLKKKRGLSSHLYPRLMASCLLPSGSQTRCHLNCLHDLESMR